LEIIPCWLAARHFVSKIYYLHTGDKKKRKKRNTHSTHTILLLLPSATAMISFYSLSNKYAQSIRTPYFFRFFWLAICNDFFLLFFACRFNGLLNVHFPFFDLFC